MHQTAQGQEADNARNGKAWFGLGIKFGMSANFRQIIITAILKICLKILIALL